MDNTTVWIASGICMLPIGYKFLKWTTNNFQFDRLDPVGLNYSAGIALYLTGTFALHFLASGKPF